jgi:quercetin dioxygenase-like cupin family protein
MERTDCCNPDYRNGDHGPAYLLRGPRSDIGIVQLRPGDDVVNHYHANVEESFIVVEGKGTVWVDCRDRYEIAVGDVYQSPPGEMHYFANESEANFRMFFIKAPYDPTDTVPVPWVPGEAVPILQK